MQSDNVIAAVALAVSVVALIGTGLQVIQQYLAPTAAGLASCDKAVIGDWHKTRKLKFRMTELRFQVLFQTPVFLVCPRSNTSGPIVGADLVFIEGTNDSLRKTRTKLPTMKTSGPARARPLQLAPLRRRTAGIGRAASDQRMLKSIHTADNEMSTWVRLLEQLHAMERESQEWQRKQYSLNPPAIGQFKFEDHMLCVAIQAKDRSWDTMPASIRRPYATTTISHLIEMAAMLGIYWKQFDRSGGHYRAEGNGFVLTGNQVPDLGVIFTFQICGQSQFHKNRLIPADEAKELAFGRVPTIYRKTKDMRRLTYNNDDIHDLKVLQLGSHNELAETLVALGCNTSTSNYIRDSHKNHSHLFPLAFEIAGMLGSRLYIKNSLFRLLPNPTCYCWDKKYFNLSELLAEYHKWIKRLAPRTPQIENLTDLSRRVNMDGPLWSNIDRDYGSQEDAKGDEEDEGELVINRKLLDSLHDSLGNCDDYLCVDRSVVQLVLREHIQELLLMVNNEGQYGEAERSVTASSPIGAGAGPAAAAANQNDQTSTVGTSLLRFDDLMQAPPEERQEKLMEIYFLLLRPVVVKKADKARQHSRNSKQQSRHTPQVSASPPETDTTSVWCTLVFRMLCWLILHDFDKMDVQVAKGELLGSRLPVYIG